jgi:hypothetical protein
VTRCAIGTAAGAAHLWEMPDETSIPEFLDAWRDTVRAAELAERLAGAATAALREADIRSDVSAEIADLAEQAADAATRAAVRARAAALEAAAAAARMREQEVPDAHRGATPTRQLETEAAAAYHLAKGQARPGS